MSAPLETAMKPVVDKSLADAGAIKAYDSMMGQYKSLPFMPDAKANLTEHVLDKALDGPLPLSRPRRSRNPPEPGPAQHGPSEEGVRVELKSR